MNTVLNKIMEIILIKQGITRSLAGIDLFLSDKMILQIGDREFEIIHIPAHGEDLVCLYCRKEKILFAGDTSLNIRSSEYSCNDDFIRVFSRLCELEIETIYWGHGLPTVYGCRELIHNSWMNRIGQKQPGNRSNNDIPGQRIIYLS